MAGGHRCRTCDTYVGVATGSQHYSSASMANMRIMGQPCAYQPYAFRLFKAVPRLYGCLGRRQYLRDDNQLWESNPRLPHVLNLVRCRNPRLSPHLELSKLVLKTGPKRVHVRLISGSRPDLGAGRGLCGGGREAADQNSLATMYVHARVRA